MSLNATESTEWELRKLEKDLLQPEVRQNPEALSSLLAEEFCEFGSSGRIYTKQEIIDALQTESSDHFSVMDLSVTVLSEDVALVRYRAARHAESGQQDSISLRSSIWVRRAKRWQMFFHQGTKVATKEFLEFDADDILSYDPEVDPSTGKSTGGMIVYFRDGTEKRFEGKELNKIMPILRHVTGPTA